MMNRFLLRFVFEQDCTLVGHVSQENKAFVFFPPNISCEKSESQISSWEIHSPTILLALIIEKSLNGF